MVNFPFFCKIINFFCIIVFYFFFRKLFILRLLVEPFPAFRDVTRRDGLFLPLFQRGGCRRQTGCSFSSFRGGSCRRQMGCSFPSPRGVAAEGRRGVPSPLPEGWLPKADGVFPGSIHESPYIGQTHWSAPTGYRNLPLYQIGNVE